MYISYINLNPNQDGRFWVCSQMVMSNNDETWHNYTSSEEDSEKLKIMFCWHLDFSPEVSNFMPLFPVLNQIYDKSHDQYVFLEC